MSDVTGVGETSNRPEIWRPPKPDEYIDWIQSDLDILMQPGGQLEQMPPVMGESGLAPEWADVNLATADAACETIAFAWQEYGPGDSSENPEYIALKTEALSLFGRGVSWGLLTSIAIKHQQRRAADLSVDSDLILGLRLRDVGDDIRKMGNGSHNSKMHRLWMRQRLEIIDTALAAQKYEAANQGGKSLLHLATKKFYSHSERLDLPSAGITD